MHFGIGKAPGHRGARGAGTDDQDIDFVVHRIFPSRGLVATGQSSRPDRATIPLTRLDCKLFSGIQDPPRSTRLITRGARSKTKRPPKEAAVCRTSSAMIVTAPGQRYFLSPC